MTIDEGGEIGHLASLSGALRPRPIEESRDEVLYLMYQQHSDGWAYGVRKGHF